MIQLAKTTNDHIIKTRAYHKNQDASIRNLESQIGQLSKQLAERAQGQFPGDTIVNLKANCKSIVTRSGIVITPQEKPKSVQHKKEKEAPASEEEAPASEKEEPARQDKEEAKKKAVEAPKQPMDFSRFEKPPYPMRKHKLQDCETVALTEECSAIIQNKFPPKLQYPGSFNIPIAVGNTNVGRALCDLGASINLMPLSICKSLGITNLKPTMVSLQLADRPLRRPNGIIEDVLVKVDKFIFLADFIVLDMEEESEMPLLLVFEEVVMDEKSDYQEFEEESKALDEAAPEEKQATVFEVLEKKEDDSATLVPKVELKEFPETLKYAFLGDKEQHPVIINKEVHQQHKESKPKVKMEKPK
ncbi:uncharacterized protein LOC133287386, partial [Gastrolobium bilobum]|uniref:uncharacterized protein LOC133287386 n=1 Tax=Gastrolobium bilobum TaxID=150636 RepID=UPI002AAF1D9F